MRILHLASIMIVLLLLATEVSMAVEKVHEDYQNPGPLVSATPAKEDYIGVAKGGRYFAHANGKAFIPIGYNHNPDWTGFVESNPARKDYNPKVTEAFFKRLHDSGVNLVRLMIETPGSGLFEDPIGAFNPEQVKWIDHIVTFARRYRVKLLMTPWDTFWMNKRWDICPYNSKLGGPVVEKVDFIIKPEVKEAQKRRLRFLVDRWGNLGDIFAWDLLNEGDIWWGETPEQLSAWAREMADYVRHYEKKRWGRSHLLTVSFAHPMPKGALGEVAYNLKELDFANTHLYIGESRAPAEPAGPAITENRGVTFSLAAIEDSRPYLDSENGPIDGWIKDQALDDEVFHYMSWAHMASGGAGSGLRWPYRHPHHLSDGMYHTLSLMARFASQVPWKDICAQPSAKLAVEASEGLIGFATGGPRAAILWIAPRDPKAVLPHEISLSWPEGPAKAHYRAYDAKSGAWIDTGTVERVDGKLAFRLAGASSSTAILVEGDTK